MYVDMAVCMYGMQVCWLLAIYGSEFISNGTRHAFLSNFYVGFHYLRRNAHLMGALFAKPNQVFKLWVWAAAYVAKLGTAMFHRGYSKFFKLANISTADI